MPDEQIFKDWIPAGGDTGALGSQGYTDFVPEPKPVHHANIEPVVAVVEPVKSAEAPAQPVEPVQPLPTVAPLVKEEA